MSFNNFPNRDATTVLPSNYHRGKSVKEYVEHYTESQKIKLDQALEVQGVEAIIWNKCLSKRFCTCQGLSSSIQNNQAIEQNVYTEEQDRLDSIEKVSEELSRNSKRITKQAKNASIVAQQNGLSDLAALIDEQYQSNEEETRVEEPKIKNFIKQNNQIEEALIAQKKNLGVEFNEYSNCPICFNTKHTDTYQPYKGQRLVFDAGDFYKLSTRGVTINKNVFPWAFEFINDSSYIEWSVELPKYFTTESIRAFYLDGIQTDCKLEFREVDSESLQPLNKITLNARSGQKNNLILKVSPNRSTFDNLKKQPIKLTHLELVLKFVDEFDKIDMPSMNIPESLEYIEIFLRSRFILSSRIEQVMRGSLIVEKKNNLVWEVLDIDKTYTASGNIVNQEVDCRVVQNSERLHLLNYLPPKFSLYKSSFLY